MEVELAQAKLDLMSLDAQLMEAIQQKVALSQQLEQWQVGGDTDTHQVDIQACQSSAKSRNSAVCEQCWAETLY